MPANNLANTKQDVIGAIVLRELKESASLLQFVRDLSSMAVKGAKQIELPKLSSFTVGDRAFGASGTESAPLSDSTDVVALDKNKYLQWGYDAADEFQSTINYMTESIKRASSAMGRQINSDILAEWDAVAGLDIVTGLDITTDDILDMREFLIANFADMSTARLVIASDQEKAILKLPEFSEYQYRGDGTAPVVNGMIGSVYGVPVVINQQVAPLNCYMVTPEGCGFAFQRSPAIGQEDNLDYGTQGKKIVADALYGVGGLQLGEGSALAGKSPLIAKKS
jgi:hypothetical protein